MAGTFELSPWYPPLVHLQMNFLSPTVVFLQSRMAWRTCLSSPCPIVNDPLQIHGRLWTTMNRPGGSGLPVRAMEFCPGSPALRSPPRVRRAEARLFRSLLLQVCGLERCLLSEKYGQGRFAFSTLAPLLQPWLVSSSCVTLYISSSVPFEKGSRLMLHHWLFELQLWDSST